MQLSRKAGPPRVRSKPVTAKPVKVPKVRAQKVEPPRTTQRRVPSLPRLACVQGDP